MRALRNQWAAAALVMVGCACPSWAAERLGLTIGVHRVSLMPPERWTHIDEGDEHRFRWRGAQIAVTDFGPVTSAGIRAEIRRARGLYQRGAATESSDILNGLRLRGLFKSQQRWRDFRISWDTIRRAGANDDRARRRAVDRAFQIILDEIARLPLASFPALATGALTELEPMDRREIAAQREVAVAGRRALTIDTWDRLTHAQRRRYVFIENEGNSLMVRTMFGAFEEMQETFDELVASLRY